MTKYKTQQDRLIDIIEIKRDILGLKLDITNEYVNEVMELLDIFYQNGKFVNRTIKIESLNMIIYLKLSPKKESEKIFKVQYIV
jgi:hypothetical protein